MITRDGGTPIQLGRQEGGGKCAKHGVSFEEARSVFLDERAKLIDDPDHSEAEARFILLGLSHRLRLLVVCHAWRSEPEEIRIISARKANKRELAQYAE